MKKKTFSWTVDSNVGSTSGTFQIYTSRTFLKFAHIMLLVISMQITQLLIYLIKNLLLKHIKNAWTIQLNQLNLRQVRRNNL